MGPYVLFLLIKSLGLCVGCNQVHSMKNENCSLILTHFLSPICVAVETKLCYHPTVFSLCVNWEASKNPAYFFCQSCVCLCVSICLFDPIIFPGKKEGFQLGVTELTKLTVPIKIEASIKILQCSWNPSQERNGENSTTSKSTWWEEFKVAR